VFSYGGQTRIYATSYTVRQRSNIFIMGGVENVFLFLDIGR